MNRGSERINRLFEFALVLLSVLAATEFQFVASVPERQAEIPYAFKVLSYPIVVLILLWLIKEAFLSWIVGHSVLKMTYTEFCWDCWAWTLFLYLLLYLLFAYGHVNVIAAVLSASLSVLSALVVSIGYGKAEPESVYFRRRIMRISRSLCILALLISSFICFSSLKWHLLRKKSGSTSLNCGLRFLEACSFDA